MSTVLQVFPAKVASTSPLTVTPVGDKASVQLPVVNTSGITNLAVGDQVRVRLRSGGALSEIQGRLG